MIYLRKKLENQVLNLANISSINILPIPVTRDGIKILNSNTLIEDYFSKIDKNSLTFCGQKNLLPENITSNNDIFDYSDSEMFLLKNSNLTAHGIIKIIYENLDIPFNKLKILISGFGRISKNLLNLLLGLESEVYILGHNEKHEFWANKCGAHYVESLNKFDQKIDFIINTVPSEIFLEKNLKNPNFASSTFIEVASLPGVKRELCDKLGIKYVLALGIPGKFYPEQASEIIKESIFNIINRLQLEK